MLAVNEMLEDVVVKAKEDEDVESTFYSDIVVAGYCRCSTIAIV